MDETTLDILNLRNLSNAVEEYVCSEVYVSKYGQDEIKDTDILLDCYEIVLDELKDLGIIFWETENSPLRDFYNARSIYYFRKLFDEDVLTKLMLQNKSVIHPIETIINSDESDDGNIQLILEVLDNTFKSHPDVLACLEFQEVVISNERFNAHIETIIKNVEHFSLPTITDIQAVSDYIKKIQNGRDWAKEAVRRILSFDDSKESPLNTDLINHLLETYDTDKIQPTEISYYSVLDKNEKDLAPEYKDMSKKYMDIHHERSPHHIEYWVAHKDKELTASNILILVAHHFEPYKTIPEMIKDIQTMIETGKTILTDNDKALIKLFANDLLNYKETT